MFCIVFIDKYFITKWCPLSILFFRINLYASFDFFKISHWHAIIFGVSYTIYMNKIHEKEIATKLQKNLSFGLTVYAGLAGGVIGIIQIVTYDNIPATLVWMTVGGFIIFVMGLPIYLSFKKGVIYGIQ